MDQMQLTYLVTVLNETQWEERDGDGRARQLSADELDARADVVWRWIYAKRRLAAWAYALWPRWRPRAGASAPASPPFADTTAHG